MHVNVIGLGHRLRHDDALGLFLMDRLQKRGVPEGVRLIKAGGDQAVLAGMLANQPQLAYQPQDIVTLIVDAICLGATPGTIHYLPNMSLPDELAADRLQLLAMRPFYFQTMEAKQNRMAIIGMEPSDLSHGVGLTPIVRRQLPALEVAVRSCIVQFCRAGITNQSFEDADSPSSTTQTWSFS